MLKVRGSILQQSNSLWGLCNIENVIIACWIMYNMIIEDERAHNLLVVLEPHMLKIHIGISVLKSIQRQVEIQNRDLHLHISHDLVEHLWIFEEKFKIFMFV